MDYEDTNAFKIIALTLQSHEDWKCKELFTVDIEAAQIHLQVLSYEGTLLISGYEVNN